MDSYYNNFYSKIAKIDAKYNGFNKIKTYLPNLSPGDKILDVGCGYGTTSEKTTKELSLFLRVSNDSSIERQY